MVGTSGHCRKDLWHIAPRKWRLLLSHEDHQLLLAHLWHLAPVWQQLKPSRKVTTVLPSSFPNYSTFTFSTSSNFHFLLHKFLTFLFIPRSGTMIIHFKKRTLHISRSFVTC